MAQNQRKGKKKQGGGNTTFYGVLGVILVAGLAAIGYALMGGAGTAATEMVELDVPNVRALYEQATPVQLGPDDAPVKVVEFGDFECPACGTFSLRVRPAIVNQYAESGQVQFVFYDFPLVSIHDYSFLAARAARCAGDQTLPSAEHGAYWAYHDKLFQEQRDWVYEQGSPVSNFLEYAAEIGLDEDAFESCLRSDRYADVVTANRQLGDQLRVSSTPTVLVNNRRVNNPSPMNLSRVIEEALAAARGNESGR